MTFSTLALFQQNVLAFAWKILSKSIFISSHFISTKQQKKDNNAGTLVFSTFYSVFPILNSKKLLSVFDSV